MPTHLLRCIYISRLIIWRELRCTEIIRITRNATSASLLPFRKGCACNNLNRPLTLVETTLSSTKKFRFYLVVLQTLSSSETAVNELFVLPVYPRGGRVYKLERENSHRLCNQICTVITKPILSDYFVAALCAWNYFINDYCVFYCSYIIRWKQSEIVFDCNKF